MQSNHDPPYNPSESWGESSPSSSLVASSLATGSVEAAAAWPAAIDAALVWLAGAVTGARPPWEAAVGAGVDWPAAIDVELVRLAEVGAEAVSRGPFARTVV